MDEPQIRFEDGTAYERMMGAWSQLVGDTFLDWLAPQPGQRWLDVGCGSGAFTELLMQRCTPSDVQGIDPAEAQLGFARRRPGTAGALFHQGDAMALPFGAARFDTAVMALVIFFVPEPAKGVAEMVRVTRPGGLVAAYAWDALGGGAPTEAIWAEMRAMGLTPTMPPRVHVSRTAALHALWTEAGLERIETRTITVRRTFANFDEFWQLNAAAGPIQATLKQLTPDVAAALEARVRASVAPDGPAPLSFDARANAVKGFVPG